MKKLLREKMLVLRKNFPVEQRLSASKRIIENFLRLDAVQKAAEIFSYVPTAEEVQIDPLLENLLSSGKKISIPFIISKSEMVAARIDSLQSLIVGKFGIRTAPEIKIVPESEIDLVIVPGLAFDRNGNRLGLGAGFYDRFLEKIPRAEKIAVAYDFQLVETVPTDFHDQKIDALVTEKGEIFF